MPYQKEKISFKTGCAIFLGIGLIAIVLMFILQTENYSVGERIGYITKFSRKGRFWKSWEGELNLTQTGMNTSSLFDFSVDNDKEDPKIVAAIDSAVTNGWKVKLSYHQVYAKNWFQNRGESDYFITKVEVLDKKPVALNSLSDRTTGKIIDTIFVVIDKSQLQQKK